MLVRGVVPALLIAALLASSMYAWLSGRRLRRIRQRSRYRLEAQAALWRHPAGRGRWPESRDHMTGGSAPVSGRPTGPEDDPDFIRALERLIRGEEDQGGGG